MKRNVIIIFATGVILLVGLFWLFSGKQSIRNAPARGNHIVALGDSLTVGVGDSASQTEGQGGWVPLVEQKLGISIVHIAQSGITTADGLSKLDDFKKEKPDIAVIFLGGNDALQRLDVTSTFNNLRSIITAMQDTGALVVLVGVRGGVFGDRYAKEFQKLADDTHSVLVPDAMQDIAFNPKLLSEDQIHPNHDGYVLMADRIAKKLGEVIVK